MKKYFFLWLIPFLALAMPSQANRQFYLSVNKSFAPSEEIIINLGDYGYGKNSDLKKVQMRLYKPKNPSTFLKHTFSSNHYGGLPDSLITKMEVVKEWDEEYSKKGGNYYFTKNINIGKLPVGLYWLEALSDNELSNIPVLVSNYSIITQKVGFEMLAYPSNSQTGKAVIDFEAYYFDANTDEMTKPDTYNNGVAYFMTDGSSNSQKVFYCKVKDEVVLSNTYFYSYGSQGNPLQSYIYTNRPAYRPDQTVHFKGVFRIKDGFKFQIPSDTMHYKITDPEGTEVGKGVVVLDGNGSFADSIRITKEMKLGEYLIGAQFKGTEIYNYSYYGGQTTGSFRVEEYKKPEYEVLVSLDKDQYILGDKVKASIEAKYFFGSPVKNAQVSWQVVREETYIPYWRSWSYWWWYEDYYGGYASNKQVVKNGKSEIGADGKLEIEFETAESDSKKLRNYKYTVIATVTDASRRAITGVASTTVAYTEYNISAYSEKYYYNLEDSMRVVVKTQTVSGSPIGTKLKAKLRSEYWGYEGKRWEYKNLQTLDIETNELTGETSVAFKVAKSGYYYIDIEGEDSRGRKTTATAYAYAVQEDDYAYNWWQKNTASITIMTDKKVYKAGEKVEAVIFTKHEADVLITANGRKLTYYQVHEMRGPEPPVKGAGKGAMKKFTFEFEPDAYGKVEISATYYQNNELQQKTETVTFIPDHKYLNVSLVFDQKSYKPRTWAEATVLVTDQNGRPVPNAQVSLGVADESIYSLYPDQTPNIQKAFYSEKGSGNYNNIKPHTFSQYKYSEGLNALAMLGRMQKFDQKFSRQAYIDDKAFFRLGNRQYEGEASGVIRGFVISAETGQPIPNATIRAKGKTFKANKYGYYSLRGFYNDYIDMVFQHGKGKTALMNVQTESYRGLMLNVEVSNKSQDHDFYPKLTKEDEANWKKEWEVERVRLDSLAKLGIVKVEYVDETLGEIIEVFDEMEVEEEIAFNIVEDADGTIEFLDKSSSGDAMGNMLMSRQKMEAPAPIIEKKPDFKEAVVRSDFQDAIYWNPNVVTNSLGMAKVKIKLPDNLTTWRTSVKVINTETQVGETIAKVVVKKNLLVRMETPRFMTVGDELLIATNIHNYLSTEKQVKVSLVADGLEVAGTEQIIKVAANGEKRIDWKVNAKWARETKLTVKALTDEESDAKELKVPVKPFGLEMITADATYVQNDENGGFAIQIPNGIDLSTANLELSFAPNITSALLGSMEDLIGYPYGCVEQTMSRFLPNVLVANTLKELKNDYQSQINQAELTKMVAQGTKRLAELQNQDGGWGWWSNDGAHPYYTSYVMHGLQLAKEAGYEVDANLYNKGLNALKSQIKAGTAKSNEKYGNPTLHAFQIMVAMKCGLNEFWNDNKPKENKFDNGYEVALWLQGAVMAKDTLWANDLAKWLEENVQSEGGRYFWGGEKYYYSWQNDQVETTANAVRALAMHNSEHKMLAGAAQWLLMQRKGKSWHNTRQTAMTIYGLNALIKQELNPNSEVEIWVNGSKIDDLNLVKGSLGKNYQIKGESFTASKSNLISSDLSLLKHGKNEIKIVQKGRGVGYLNGKLSYFLQAKSDLAEAVLKNSPFSVKREYFKLVQKEDKKGNLIYEKQPIAKASIKSGDEILVKVKVSSTAERDHVLIEDPIPAGCEFVRETTGFVIPGESAYDGKSDYYNSRYWGWNWNRWYTHQEFRDTHFAMTITKLYKGSYEYSYILKAQIPGKFNVTPAVAQLMYYPEVRGFSEFSEMEIKE